MLGIEAHRHARVLAPAQQVLVDVAVDLVVAGQLRQRGLGIGDPAAALELALEQGLVLGHARAQGGRIRAHGRLFAAQLLVQRVDRHQVAVAAAAARLRGLAARGLGDDLVLQVLELVADPDHVRVVVGVGQQQAVEFGLQLDHARAVLALATLAGADLGLALELLGDRPIAHLQLRQVGLRGLDALAQLADAGVDVGRGARARVLVLGAELLEPVLGPGQLAVVLLDPRGDELVGLAALALLRRQALRDEHLGELARHPEGAVGIRVLVRDLDQVLAAVADHGRRLEPLGQALLLEQRGLGGQPAAFLQDRGQDLAAVDDLARDAAAVGDPGGDRAPFHERLDDVVLLDQDGGRGGVGLGPQGAQRQRDQRDGGEHHDHGHPAPVRLVGQDRQLLLQYRQAAAVLAHGDLRMPARAR